MSYTVVWLPVALDELAEIWLLAPDRNAVTSAAAAIDTALGTAPHAVGTGLFDTVYEYTQHPLAVEYEVSDPDRFVTIATVWDTDLGRPNPTGN